MTHDTPAYGLWFLVAINSIVFILFAFSFTHPKTGRDWRSFGGFSAFIVALFAEMYGFPLTIYLMSGWLSSRYPGLDLYGHDSGHLLHTLFGIKGDPHFDVFHILSSILIFAGFMLLAASWRVLYKAQQNHELATTGPHAHVRHPQYSGFIMIMLGFLLQWPTILTLGMFPILVLMYARLARREERDVLTEFGDAYALYAGKTPAFVPRIFGQRPADRGSVYGKHRL